VEGVAHKSDRTSEKTNMETKIENQGEQLDPVTIVFARDVKPDRVDEFEQWVKDIREVVRQFEGYQGMDVIRPGDHAHPEYVIVLRFDDYPCLRAWMASPEREEWVQKSKPLTIGETFIQEAHGFEPWFTLPDDSQYRSWLSSKRNRATTPDHTDDGANLGSAHDILRHALGNRIV
jgi:antibiotic biosynthesis monooxygenase (ABM) superfamily enzyme